MKTNIRRITNILSLLVLATVLIQGCSDISDPHGDSNLLSENYEGISLAQTCVDETTTELTYSPWKKYGGDISYEIDDENVIVTYIPREGWGITETHLLVTTDEGELSFIPGQFPFGDEFDDVQVDPIVYEIPLSDLGLSSGDDLETLYIYAHAVTGELTSSSGGGGGWYGNNNKWGNWSKWGKKNHKWGKKGSKWGKKGSKWGKKGDKKDRDGKKYYCDKDKTESVWAKIKVKSFEECNNGSIGGGGVD